MVLGCNSNSADDAAAAHYSSSQVESAVAQNMVVEENNLGRAERNVDRVLAEIAS